MVVHGADTPLGATFVRLLAERGDHVAAMAEAPARRPLLADLAARRLLRAGTQPVVFAVTSWLGGFADRRDGGHYGQAMTAAALQMAMRSLAFDMEPDGVTVTCGNPGLYRTALHAPEIQPLPEDVVGGFLALLATPDPARHGRVVDWRGNLKEW